MFHWRQKENKLVIHHQSDVQRLKASQELFYDDYQYIYIYLIGHDT